MKRLLLILALIIVALPACLQNTENGDCNFDIDTILNGSDIATQLSEWDCLSGVSSFSWALFANGNGIDSDLGQFTWQEAGCRSIQFSTTTNTGTVDDLDGSIEEERLTFTQFFQGSLDSVTCILDLFP